MAKLYLVTGFLGAGKTTFLKNFIDLFPKKRLAVIINEFGKEGIDGKLLSSLGITLSEISNGSIFCSCRQEQFEQVLRDVVNKGPEVIIVETSGLSDPTNINQILSGKSFSDIQYMGSICMVDALNFKKVYSTARVCKRQVSVSGVAIINKTDLVNQEEIQEVKDLLLGQKPHMKIFETTFGNIEPEWVGDMAKLASQPIPDSMGIKDITLQKYLVTLKDTFTYRRLVKFIEMFVEDTYRIKGFVVIQGETYFVDCVYGSIKIERYRDTLNPDILGKLVILSGKGMPTRRSILEAVNWYRDEVEDVK